jgi:lysozyme
MLNMQPSQWLWDYLKGREQFRPTAFRPTKRDRWTIGYGHTKGVQPGDTCTLDQADYFLKCDVAWAVEAVNRAVTVPLTQPQFDALVSFVYNVGAPAFFTSTLLKHLDAGDYKAAANDLLAWDHQDGVVVYGLEVRREQERQRFLTAA